MEKLMKAILSSFAIGGLFGVLVQALYSLYALAFGADNKYLMVFALITGGFVVMLLFISGITDKTDKAGGFGAIIPLIGIVSATAGVPILGAGEFIFTSVCLGMILGIWEATVERILIFTGIVAMMFIWGALGAFIRGKIKPQEITPD